MPILNGIFDHQVIGPAIRQGRQEGRQEIVRLMLEKRFGALPPWAETRLMGLSVPELDDLAMHLLDATRCD